MKTPREPNTHEMRNGDDDLSALYRKAPRPEPDAGIDDVILQASRHAVVRAPRVARPFSARWQVPASIAAVILITVVLAPALYQHADPERDTTVPTTTRPAAPMGDGRLGSDVGAAEATAPVEVPASPAPMMTAPLQLPSTIAEPNEWRARMSQSYSPAVESAVPRELEAAPAADDDIDVMLERIRRLLEDGDRDAAQREFARFKMRYPNAAVDSDLMQQLHDR